MRFPAKVRLLQPRSGKWALTMVCAAAVLGIGIRAYLDVWRDARHRLESERALLASDLHLVSTADAIGQALQSGERAFEARAGRLLPGEPISAVGVLLRFIAEQTDSSRLLLESTEVGDRDDPVAPPLVPVRVRLQGAGDIEGALELLRRIEDGPYLLAIEQFEMRHRGAADAGAGAQDAVEVVSVAATIVGYALLAEGGEQ